MGLFSKKHNEASSFFQLSFELIKVDQTKSPVGVSKGIKEDNLTAALRQGIARKSSGMIEGESIEIEVLQDRPGILRIHIRVLQLHGTRLAVRNFQTARFT